MKIPVTDPHIRQTRGTAEELHIQNARLAALHRMTLDLTSRLDLNAVLQQLVEIAQTLSGSAHAHLFLYDPDRRALNLAASHWSGQDRVVPLKPRRSGITYAVARSGEPIFIEDTSGHPAYARVPAGRKPGAVACLPLVTNSGVSGTLNLGYWEPHVFDASAREFLELVARHAAIAIENARLSTIAIANARLEQELEVARRLQARLIPEETPRLPGWEFAAFWEPARVVGGDFYDFVPLGAPANHGADGAPLEGIVIADVSDKGMPAALFMAVARSTLRGSLNSECCPSDSFTHANRLLCADSANGMFVTAFYLQLNPKTGELIYVNAGHNLPLLYRARTDELMELPATGMALGVQDDREYTQGALHLAHGDFMLLYTDGVIDALDAHEQRFGIECLRELVYRHRRGSAAGLAGQLEQRLSDFVGNNPPFDDITAVMVKRDYTASQEPAA